MITFLAVVIAVLSVMLLVAMRAANLADNMATFLATIIKGQMLVEKKDESFLAECYCIQADDFILKFDYHKYGITLLLAKR